MIIQQQATRRASDILTISDVYSDIELYVSHMHLEDTLNNNRTIIL